MKTTLALLATLACCAAALPAARADESKNPARRLRYNRDTEYVYISNDTATGSHVPTVLRWYRGTLTSASAGSPLAVYGRRSLDISGSDDVATALYKLDPSISINRRTR